MYESFYNRIAEPWRRMKAGSLILTYLDKALVYLVAAAYAVLIVWLVVHLDIRVIRVVLVPALTFGLVTLARALIDAPRPYEAEPITPLVHKDTLGKSFPSRHVSSAAIISFAYFWINPLAGAIACAITLGIAYVRVAGGVHYPRDVFTAIVVAIGCGCVGFILIP